VMAVADRRDHVPAIVAQMLDRFLPRDVALIGHEDREDEDEGADDQGDHPALEAPLVLEGEVGPGGGHAPRCRLPAQINDGPMVPPASADAGGTMIWTTRTIGLLLTMAMLTGGAVWGVHALIASAGGAGSDYGLDTNGNGKFEWLVVEAQVSLPKAGTWDVSADLSGSSPPVTGLCGGVSG